jgi:hypothetical protein
VENDKDRRRPPYGTIQHRKVWRFDGRYHQKTIGTLQEDCKEMTTSSIKQRFKDLMRHRTTEDKGLTFAQIFCEVYQMDVERYTYRNPDLGRSELDAHNGNLLAAIAYNDDTVYGKCNYLKYMIKQLRKTDDEFRWLSILPVKRNQVDRYRKKVRPYLEYKYINIKASETPELLEQVNEIWAKHAQGCIKGLEEKNKRLDRIIERTSTKEGQREHMIAIKSLNTEIECKVTYLNTRDNAKTLDKIISELKDEDRLPRKYRPNYSNISKILEREIADRKILAQMMRQMPDVILYDEHKRKEEIRKTVKDIIASTFDTKQFEKEQASNSKKYDWQALDYR